MRMSRVLRNALSAKGVFAMSPVLQVVLSVCVFVCTTGSASSLPTDCSLAGWSVPKPPDGATLLQVQAVIRHGDRTPWTGDFCWPQDSSVWNCYLTNAEVPMYSDYQYGPVLPRIYRKIYKFGNETLNGNCSVGQLTQIGFEQQLRNGKTLYDAYISSGFLSPHLSSREVYIRSDDESRTLHSAEALLLGMYPPDSSSTATQTVELFTMDPTYDYMTVNPNLCPRIANYSTDFKHSSNWTSHYNNVTAPLLASVKEATNFAVDEDDLDHFCDCLRTHYCHGLEWPQGINSDIFHRLWAELTWQAYGSFKYPSIEENAQAGIGHLLKELWQNMDSVITKKPTPKFLLYSGHDATLIPILVALKADQGVWPSYASMMLMELYNTSSGFSVRLVYNGDVVQLPFCGSTASGLCDYKSFSSYMATVTPNSKTNCTPESKRQHKWRWY